MIYNQELTYKSNPLPQIIALLDHDEVGDCELRMALSHFIVSGVQPETNEEFINILQEIQDSSLNTINVSFSNAINILKKKDIFNG